MRKLIIALVLFLAVAFVILRFSEFQNILNVLHHSNYRFLIAAVVVEGIWFYNSATDYAVLYRPDGTQAKSQPSDPGCHGCQFINVIAPTAGIGGMAVFMEDAKREDHPAEG